MIHTCAQSLKIVLILLLVSVTSSCDLMKKEDPSSKKFLVKAEKNLEKNPDSTIAIVNKLLLSSSKQAIDNEEQLALLQLKHRAFSELEIMDSVCVIGQKIREVASRIPDSLAIAETLLRLYGNIDYKYLTEAKPYLLGGIRTFESNNKEFEKAILLELYGNIMNEEGDYKKSQKYYLQALKIFESKDSTYAMSRINNELGVNFACSGIMNKSNDYYRKAIKIAEIRKDSSQQSAALLNLGINYKKSNPEQAIQIYQQALEVLPKKAEEMERLILYYNMANIYFDDAKYDKAEPIYKKVLEVSTKNNYQDGIIMSKISLGNVYGKKKQFALAESYFLTSLKILEETNQKNLIYMTLPMLISTYESAGDFKKAFDYSNQLLKLKDSLVTIEKTKSILELEKKYQTEKKDLEIINLDKLSSLRYKIILLLLVSLVIVFLLWRHRNRLYHENKNAYAVLMNKYKVENKSLNKKGSMNLIPKNDTETIDLDDVNALLYQKLLLYYENKKPYLDSKLKAEFVAKVLEVSQRDITLVIKENGFSGFANFNNWFRVEEVKKCFDDMQYASIKTMVIATECGFGSKQPFYNAFEEFTGLNPGFYRDEIAKK